MSYQLLKLTEWESYKDHWLGNIANKVPIETHDGISVSFNKNDFWHFFFKEGDGPERDRFAWDRGERMNWVKECIQDSNATLKFGWDNANKRTDFNRRVSVIQGNYIVVVRMVAEYKARGVTAYPIDSSGLAKLLLQPDWTVDDCVWVVK
jgi:hypothetical protein